MNARKFIISSSLVLSVGLLLAGCGGASPAPVVAAPGGIVNGVGTYASGTCYGTVITKSAGSVCYTQKFLSLALVFSSRPPSLLPNDNPAGPNAVQALWNGSALTVKAGDKLTFRSNPNYSGLGKITTNSHSYLGGLITINSGGSCDAKQLDDPSGGLYATDGTEIFLVGDSVVSRAMPRDGTLKIGFNDSWLAANASWCWNLVYSAVLEHCENTAGATVDCYAP